MSRFAISPVNILHLSDLHFGWEGEVSSETNRKLALNGLIRSLNEIEFSWLHEII